MNHDPQLLLLPTLQLTEVPIPAGAWQRVQARARRRRHQRTAVFSAAVFLAAAGPVALLLTGAERGPDVARQAAPGEIAGLVTAPADQLSRNHFSSDTSIDYPTRPPLGGDHDATPQQCGAYDSPIRTEHAVHSMEHGAVWITYLPTLEPEEVGILRDLVERGAPYVLLSPFPEQNSRITATAWGKQLRVDAADDLRLGQFVDFFANGPQTPERGAACIGTTSASGG